MRHKAVIKRLILGAALSALGFAAPGLTIAATPDDPTSTSTLAMPAKPAKAKHAAKPAGDADANNDTNNAPKNIDVSADQSLEWYQDQQLYVARGNAKAIRGDMVIDADTLTAHQRDKPKDGKKSPKTVDAQGNAQGSGDIDKMVADGNVRITDPKQRVTGDHAVDDVDQHVMVVTGKNLKYETEKETVTAKDSLEYYDEKKIAVARGHAVADKGDRHVEGDVLTAEFRDLPDGSQELWKMTALGHVTVITKGDVSRGDEAVYDTDRDVAVMKGNVKITRVDGTQLSGDVGEVDFKTNQSRLLNEGKGRVRALLASKTSPANGASTTSTDGTTKQKPAKTKPAKTTGQNAAPDTNAATMPGPASNAAQNPVPGSSINSAPPQVSE
jgi:lipopolysaccharide export system protein LptA